MINIYLPDNNRPEKKYVIYTIFSEFLGINYNLFFYESYKDYIIELENGSRLYLKNSFFKYFPDDLSYINANNIPKHIEFLTHSFLPENNIPILYGDPLIKVEENSIYCGIDIFASIYFMISRWEEYANRKRDSHNRFPCDQSIAYLFNFLDRPIVNEYIEILWNMLVYLNIEQERKVKSFKLILTHDIDNFYKWCSVIDFFRLTAGDLIVRKNISSALENVINYYKYKMHQEKDPYNTFDWLMLQSDILSTKSIFYFMTGGNSNFDNRYSILEPAVQKTLNSIISRGHLIGLHGSYESYNNFSQWKTEKETLELACNHKVVESRQHYLRFEVPKTWRIMNDNKILIDSSCGYVEKEGFRCGTGDEYRVFDIIKRKKLKIKERPLIVMDQSLFTYQRLNMEQATNTFNRLKNKSKKYKMSFVILAHNSFVGSKIGQKFYKHIIKGTKSEL